MPINPDILFYVPNKRVCIPLVPKSKKEKKKCVRNAPKDGLRTSDLNFKGFYIINLKPFRMSMTNANFVTLPYTAESEPRTR
jgi:hypothetical protein